MIMIEYFQNLHLDQLLQNQFFTGAAAAGIIGAILLKARSVGTWIFRRLYITFVTSIELNSQNSKSYNDFVGWIFAQKTFSNLKTLSQVNQGGNDDIFDDDSEQQKKEKKLQLSPSDGTYFGWIGFRPVWVRCTSQTNEMNGSKTYYVTCSTTGWTNHFFKDVLTRLSNEHDRNSIWLKTRHQQQRKTKRPLGTIHLQNGILEEIVADMERFSKDRERYESRGIQWKRNYLFEGPPGTGKTSLILALASHFDRSINLLAANVDDSDVRSTYYNSHSKEIVAFEDIDGMTIQIERDDEQEEEGEEVVRCKDETIKIGKRTFKTRKVTTDKEGVQLSTILNCLDGLNSSEGTISIITTNCPEKLDAALLRAGRIDKRFKLDYFTFDFAVSVYEKFVEDKQENAERDIEAWFGKQEGNYIVPAALQEKLYEITFK